MDFATFVNNKKSQSTAIDNVEYAFSYDRLTRTGFKYMKPVEWAMSAAIRYFKYWEKNKLLASSVRVSDKQFPRVYSLLKTAATTLNIPIPTMYITSNPQMNAATFGTNEDSFIIVHSSLIDHFTDEEFLDVIGHECGHIQNGHVVALTTLYFLTNLTSVFVEWIAFPAELALQAWSRICEVSADRAALLVSKDIDVSVRANIKLALGSQKLYDQINVEEYMTQYEDGKTGMGRFFELYNSHPILPKRCASLKVFAETELYRKHIGLTGGISMVECDERVNRIISVL